MDAPHTASWRREGRVALPHLARAGCAFVLCAALILAMVPAPQRPGALWVAGLAVLMLARRAIAAERSRGLG